VGCVVEREEKKSVKTNHKTIPRPLNFAMYFPRFDPSRGDLQMEPEDVFLP